MQTAAGSCTDYGLESGADMAIWASVERRGIDPVGAAERHGRSADLGWVWFAANIGVLSLVFGAVLSAFGLDLSQAVAATTVGAVGSFLLVGVVAVAGKWGGMPTLALSRAAFGRLGNLGPAAIGWVNIIGWEVVTSVIAAWSLAMLVGLALPWKPGPLVDALCLVAVVAISLIIGFLGHGAIMWFQRIASYAFGALTLLVVVFLATRTHWHAVASAHAAAFGAFAAATSIVAAGTGVSWVNLAADYSRYLPRSQRGSSIVRWVVIASAVPTILLVLVGYLLASALSGFTGALDPIRPLGVVLPPWMAAPYLVAAVGGMLAETDLACYSSGLGLLALGVRVRRSRTILIDTSVVLAAGLVIMLSQKGFLGPFESFLEVLADGLAAWAGVFVADMWQARHRAIRYAGHAGDSLAGHYQSPPRIGLAGLCAWSVGTSLALATTVCPWFTGPLAAGVLRKGSYGFAVGFTCAVLVFLFTNRRAYRPDTPGEGCPGAAVAAPMAEVHGNPGVAAGGLIGFSAGERSAIVCLGEIGSSARLSSPLGVRPERLVLVGSVLVDVLVYVDRLPDRGSDVFASERRISTGGGFNVLSAASRLGLRAAYAGRVGDGVFGRQVARDLELDGVSLLLGFTQGEDTGFDIGIVEASGERTFLTAPGTESRLGASELALIELAPADAVYVSGYDLLYPVAGPAIASWIKALSSQQLLVVDPGPIAVERAEGFLREVLGRVGVLSLNSREAALLGGSPDPAEAAIALSSLIAPDGVVVVRLGAQGCLVATDSSDVAAVPGWSAAALDTTGAGDVHVGAFLARLAAGDGVLTAAAIANAAAAWSTERAGGASGPRADDLVAFTGAVDGSLADPSLLSHRASAPFAGEVG